MMETAIYAALIAVAGLAVSLRMGRFVGKAIKTMNPPEQFECMDCRQVFDEESLKIRSTEFYQSAFLCHLCALYRDRPELRVRDAIDDGEVAQMAQRFITLTPQGDPEAADWLDSFTQEYQEITDTPAHEHTWIEHHQFGQPACLRRVCACGASERRQSEDHRWTLDMPRTIRDAATLPHQTAHEEIAALSDDAYRNRNRVQPGADLRKRRKLTLD